MASWVSKAVSPRPWGTRLPACPGPRPLALCRAGPPGWGFLLGPSAEHTRGRPVRDDPVPAPARGASPSRTACLLQVEHDFILQAERETFIEQMKDVMDKAEDMLSEDTDIDRGSDPGMSPPHLSTCGLGTGEVSPGCGVPKGPGLAADAPGLPEAAAGHAVSGEAAGGGGG